MHAAIRKKEVVNSKGEKKKITEQRVIFPRFHQYDVIHKVIDDVIDNGSGRNYLINHSAGSGKSNSIAWLAYRLASAFDRNEKLQFEHKQKFSFEHPRRKPLLMAGIYRQFQQQKEVTIIVKGMRLCLDELIEKRV